MDVVICAHLQAFFYVLSLRVFGRRETHRIYYTFMAV